MKIYACQMTVRPGRPDLNFKTIEKYVAEARAAGALFEHLHARPTHTAADVHEKGRTHAELRARPDLARWRPTWD